jgi:hypothetical protein
MRRKPGVIMHSKRNVIFLVIAAVVAVVALVAAVGELLLILRWQSQEDALLMDSRTKKEVIWSQLHQLDNRIRPHASPETSSVVTHEGGVIGDRYWTIVWTIKETIVDFQSPKASVVRPLADLRICWLPSAEKGGLVIIAPGEAPESEKAAEIIARDLEAEGIRYCIVAKCWPADG